MRNAKVLSFPSVTVSDKAIEPVTNKTGLYAPMVGKISDWEIRLDGKNFLIASPEGKTWNGTLTARVFEGMMDLPSDVARKVWALYYKCSN